GVQVYDVHRVGRGLADLYHGLGDGRGDVALLLRSAAGIPLDGDVGHESSFLLEPCHIVGKVGCEGVGLDGAVAVEAHGKVLRLLRAPVALAEEPAPRRIPAVDADLVRLAEEAPELSLVGLAHGDRAGVRRSELSAAPR